MRRGFTIADLKADGKRPERRGFTIADLKADGKRPECRVIDDRCEVWKQIVKTMGKKRCWQRI